MSDYRENRFKKDRKKVKSLAVGILKDYPELDGLKNIFTSIWSLSNNRNFKVLVENIEEIERIFHKESYFILQIPKKTAKNIPQIEYARDILFPSKIYYILPNKTVDILYYSNLTEIVFTIRTFNNEINTHKAIFDFSHKVMMLLSDFDKDIPFNGPNEDYFRKLKNLKWDKTAEKLLKRTYKVFNDYESTIADQVVLENPDTEYPIVIGIFSTATKGTLIFLSACSAIKDGRDVMIWDDVVCAYKTYFKLLDLLNKP